MKSLKLILNLMLLAVVATACGKKKGGGAAAPAPTKQTYYLQGNNCYEKDTNKQVDRSYCDDDNYQGGQCVGYVYYIMYRGSSILYIDRVRCDQNSLYNECEDPEAYANPGEKVVCEDADYGSTLY